MPRDPRQEAVDRLGGRYEARVLEPSPPAVAEEPWFADDPTERGAVPAGRQVVSPVTTGDVLWQELAEADPALAEWCSPRWLASFKPLEPAPPTLGVTRAALHRLAERVISPVRQRANGKIGLRWTLGGFGTPFFGADAQIRVDGGELVIATSGEERRHPLSTIRDAAAAIGFDLSGADEAQAAGPLEVDGTASRFVGDWFGFTTSVLEQLRAEAQPEWEPSRVQLWPEHFDIGLETGNEQAEQRATLGGSPGDGAHPEPYLYVAPWSARPEGELWQARGFPGAELRYADLLAAADQRAAAFEFFRVRLAALNV
ncbi:MAG: hypothetical protein QOH76_1192 [Thermoleophilaceae bacterium]|jgi:hypothetical protein|nr:hypothetical protein [Thermoleophilaceae bacterium]